MELSRRSLLKTAAASVLAASLPNQAAEARVTAGGTVAGILTGAQAVVDTLLSEGTTVVFGIPGAQENELWDQMKARGLGYLLVTHEFSAACMADGYARSTGQPGVLCIVPGPGVTNACSGLGEALLDSVPLVAIVGDVARGDKYKAFQVHELPQVGLLQQVTKAVFEVTRVTDIATLIRQAFRTARGGEPGPVAVVIPYNLLTETAHLHSPPCGPLEVPFDDNAFTCALQMLADRRQRVGLYVGLGCMDHATDVVRLAEVLQAPVATSVSGKGVIDECHPLSVGWGYGGQGTRCAEAIFKDVDIVLAMGVRYSEVSTAFYSIPKHRVIHVDINANNLNRVVPATPVHADVGVFLTRLLACADTISRPACGPLLARIRQGHCEDARENAKCYSRCGVDPMAFILTLRAATCADALTFVDVTASEHWAAEAYTVRQPRTYFNPTDNQAMGWSVPASLGAQRAFPARQVVTITGDGCFLMSAMEITTAARECLPVKFFILDDQAYHYMQALQKQAYRRTTATILARLDYQALAKGFGVGYQEITGPHDLEGGIKVALSSPGPMLTRVITEYSERPLRWLEAAKHRYVGELTPEQKARFMARLGSRALQIRDRND